MARRHRDEVDRVRFEGEEAATPAPGVVEAIEQAELIVVCPSNPFVSIWPILAVSEIRWALERRRVPSVAVSPLVGGRAIKGPADRMLERLAGGTDPGRVATCYPGSSTCSSSTSPIADAAHGVELQGVRPVDDLDADVRRGCGGRARRDRAGLWLSSGSSRSRACRRSPRATILAR